MAENNNLIPTEPDWDGTPLSRAEEIMYSIIHSEEWNGEPLSRGEYLLLQIKDVIENNSMLDLKGRVDTIADLPATGNKKGDTYSVGPEDQLNLPEYFWTGTEWQYLGQIVDLSGYLQLSGGTMTGPLAFNLGGKTFEIKTYDNKVYVTASNSSIHLEAQTAVEAKGNFITLDSDSGTTINGYKSSGTVINTIEQNSSGTSIKGYKSSGSFVNTLSQTATGTSITTGKALSMTSGEGLTVNNSGAPTTVTSNAQDLTVQTNGGNALIQAQNGTMDLKSTGGKMTLYTAGGQTPGLFMESWGGPITAMSTNYVSITSPYAAGYVYLQGGTGSSEANINLSGGSISETAYANVTVTATNGVMTLSSGNNSSWTAAGNLDLTATNGQARLQGATVSIADQNTLITMGTPGTTVSVNNGRDLTLQTSGTAGTAAGDINVLSILGDVVVGAGNDLLLSAINGSIESNSSDYELEAYNSETDQQADIHNYHGTVVTEFTPSTQNDPASNKITIKADHTISGNPGTTEGEAKIELTSDDGGLIAMTTPAATLNDNPLRATVLLTQAEYDALVTKDPNVVYNIYEPDEEEGE